MSKFIDQEKISQIKFKAESPTFSVSARAEGMYRGRLRPFCLPVHLAEENLYPEIRQSAPQFFEDQNIKWHDGQNGKPSNHLCDSQVCCVNFLFPFADKPNALAKLIKPLFPQLQRMLPIEKEKYVSFEWIGLENYLGERMPKNGKRTRGANFTSADAAIRFERKDGKQQIVLIEWKYTESYGSSFLKISKGGTDRTLIYQHLFDKLDCPINKALLPSFDALFYEPFYQFMRQQLLAQEMEKAHELGADYVSLLHISPARNTDFQKVTSPALEQIGDSVTGIWKKLVHQEKFQSISSEELFGKLKSEEVSELNSWLVYIQERYPWVKQG